MAAQTPSRYPDPTPLVFAKAQTTARGNSASSRGPTYDSYDDQLSLPPRSWLIICSVRESCSTHSGESYATRYHSPPCRPSSRESPITLAPRLPGRDPYTDVPCSISAVKLGGPSVMARAGSHRSRPGLVRPVYPLDIESPPTEENALRSASGIAVPSPRGQRSSPAKARFGADCFGASTADWARQKHKAAEMVLCPPSGSRVPSPRKDSQAIGYRTANVKYGEVVSTKSE